MDEGARRAGGGNEGVGQLLDRLHAALQGRYTIEREIGHGGMAVVYLSRDHKQASAGMFGGSIGGAFHASAWGLERLGELWLRCEGCGGLRDARTATECRCGAPVQQRPAFW